MKRTATYTSSMHISIRYYVYEPEVVLRIKGIVQIHHGLGEHADRYEHFASFLAARGFVVVVSDFAGHGRSLIDFEQGYFGEHDGPMHLIEDMHHLQMIIRETYPDSPYFMLGVDLGSVLIRQYMSVFGDFIEGALLLGTPSKIDFFYLKKAYLRLLKIWKGPLHKAQQYSRYVRHHLNKQIHMTKEMDWLTSDEQEKRKFLDDPMTHFVYTVQGYRDIIHMIKEVNSEKVIMNIPSYLSLYIAVGEADPMSQNIKSLVEKYKNVPIRDLTFEIFPNQRHALLFEKDKKIVYNHILKWLNERTYL